MLHCVVWLQNLLGEVIHNHLLFLFRLHFGFVHWTLLCMINIVSYVQAGAGDFHLNLNNNYSVQCKSVQLKTDLNTVLIQQKQSFVYARSLREGCVFHVVGVSV